MSINKGESVLLKLKTDAIQSRTIGLRSPLDDYSKKVSVAIVDEVDIRIFLESSQDAIAETSVRQDFRCVRGQNRIADVRVPISDIRNRKIVRQMTGTDNLDPIVKNEDANRCRDKIVPVDERICNKFLEDNAGNLRKPSGVHTLVALLPMDVAQEEAKSVFKLLLNPPVQVSAVNVFRSVNVAAWIADRLHMKHWEELVGSLAK